MEQTSVTYFRRYGKITEEDKMHLAVDHYLEEVEIDEETLEPIKELLYNRFIRLIPEGKFTNLHAEGYADQIIEAILSKLK